MQRLRVTNHSYGVTVASAGTCSSSTTRGDREAVDASCSLFLDFGPLSKQGVLQFHFNDETEGSSAWEQ